MFVGFLNFVCFVIRLSRVFLYWFIDLMVGVCMFNYCIRFNREVKEDLNLWLFFLFNFNGKYFFFEDIWFSLFELNFFIDVLGVLGFGVLFGFYWCYGKWLFSW